MVTAKDIVSALCELGICEGDTVLVHSSLKSFGEVERGADDVIDALLTAVGGSGTVVMPTFVMKEFADAYKTWHMDKPSDTGYITEVFRKRGEAKRSNQATHSVAAIGAKADFLTKTHGHSGLRRGTYGDTPFSADSPWQKLYDMNAKVVMLGAKYESYTFRHFCEYMLVEKALKIADEHGKYEEFVKNIHTFETRYSGGEGLFWPYLNYLKFEEKIFETELNTKVTCGKATLQCSRAKEVCDLVMAEAFENPKEWFDPCAADWYLIIKEL